MKVGTRIFLCSLLISAVCLYFPFDWVLDTMRTRYLEGVEDPLVDQANTLAGVVEAQLRENGFSPEEWQAVFAGIEGRRLNARIYELVKERVDTHLYITDGSGRVLFHSAEPTEVGEDYSRWRDVHLTLAGEYGARTSRPADGADSSVLYVAAPVMLEGQVAGVVTVGKPTTNISWFVENAKLQVVAIGSLALAAAGLLSFLVARWLTRPIYKLTSYARQVRDGGQPEPPILDSSEIGEMGRAFVEMREALEGKRYVEQYVQNLTHELKSPLSAIRGAAELLDESMDSARRAAFIDNIRRETLRIQAIVERMLELSALENRKKLVKVERVALQAVAATVAERLERVLAERGVALHNEIPDDLPDIDGDPFLLHQAVGNLVQNSIDFSPSGGVITLAAVLEDDFVTLSVVDGGTGLAPYVQQRLFEKFFSLQRPHTGQKSTGLGLNFVRQVALLHGGEISLENNEGAGVTARLTLKRSAV